VGREVAEIAGLVRSVDPDMVVVGVVEEDRADLVDCEVI